jgi:hypothetical protein
MSYEPTAKQQGSEPQLKAEAQAPRGELSTTESKEQDTGKNCK